MNATAEAPLREGRDSKRRRGIDEFGRDEGIRAAAFFHEVRPTVGFFAAVYLTGKFMAAFTTEYVRAIA